MALLIMLAFAFVVPVSATSKDPISAITTPIQGQHVNGLVQIIGIAIHPAFDHYELHFALDPNPTNTWFPIVLMGIQPVENAPLAQWETGSISAGIYMLRLQVFGSDGSLPTEAIVPGIAVRAGPDPTTPTPKPTAAVTITPALVPTVAQAMLSQNNARNTTLRNLFAQLREKHNYRSIFVNSAAYSITMCIAMGLYLRMRTLIRPHVRRLLRRMRSDLRRP